MKLWLTICAALVFAAGCTVGMLLRFDRFCGQTAPAPANIVSDVAAGESVVASMVDPYPDYPLYLVSGTDVYDELQLQADQRERLVELFKQHFDAIDKVRTSMAEVAAELREGVLRVLSPEQEVRFNEVQKRYSESKIRSYVGRELHALREEVGLRLEQEAAVYKHLYDAASDRRAAYRRKPCKDRNEICRRVNLINKKLDSRIKQALFPDQFAAYVKYQERKSALKQKKQDDEREETKRKDDEDCAPATAPGS